MNTDRKPNFSKSPTWKAPTFREEIFIWMAGVIKMRRWEKIDIDEYVYILSGRKDIQDKLEKEKLDDRMMQNLLEADNNFMKLSKETQKSVLYFESSNILEPKKKYWFLYRILECKYENWLIYARF